ncbi:orotidine-5'-phosphate decarboxylase [Deltaproteobacteria bacterium]|nr:orotidine-5'-phosphate decarboxylase [Deltaproteobacteria bacterium]
MSFIKVIEAAWENRNTLLCVGLDTDPNQIPPHLKKMDAPIFEFNKAIVDSTADLVCAYKPQIAYYSASGTEQELEMTIEYVHRNYPEIPVILDAKRGDIGSTANMYAIEAFDRYGADAVTVNPYMGSDTLEPFLNHKEKGIIILCRTSNPGAREIQDLESKGKKIYRIIAEKASGEWNYNDNVLLVVGATYPEEVGEIRSISGEMPFLVPGIGAQGGDVEKTVKNGRSRNGAGMIINSSRGIIYASPGRDFAEAARNIAMGLRDEINRYRK